MLDFCDFVNQLFSFSHGDGELSKLDEDIAQKFGDLLGNGVRGQKDVVLLGPLFDFVLVLIEGFQSIDVNKGDSLSGGFINVDDIGEDTNLNKHKFTLILLKALLGSLTDPLNLFSGS